MGEYAAGASPPQTATGDELDTLWTEYVGYCTDLRNGAAWFYLIDSIVEPLRIKPSGASRVLTTGLAKGLPPLVVASIVAALAGQWDSAPIWRWAIVSLWFALTGMAASRFMGASIVEQFSMDRALTKPDDLRKEIAFVHRWLTPGKSLLFGVSFALVCLAVVGLLVGARNFVSVPAGSVALLAIVFYHLGELAYISLLWVFGLRVSSELEYRVSWPSPLDSPWVRPALRGQAQNEAIRSVMVTGDIVVVAVLLSLNSPLLLPATVVLLFTGYATILASIVAARLCFQRIVTRAKEARLSDLQTRIDAFGEQPMELDEAQFGELTRLIELHYIIGRARTNLRAHDDVTRLVTLLALPTLTFVGTVVAHEYVGRLFGKFLP